MFSSNREGRGITCSFELLSMRRARKKYYFSSISFYFGFKVRFALNKSQFWSKIFLKSGGELIALFLFEDGNPYTVFIASYFVDDDEVLIIIGILMAPISVIKCCKMRLKSRQ